MVRKATATDLDAIERIYDALHTSEEAGRCVIGWKRGVYPTRATATDALRNGHLYVLEHDGDIRGAAIINKTQLPEYALGQWKLRAADEDILVLHTLVIDPDYPHKGYGNALVEYYISMGRSLGCKALRIDTQACNARARRFYPRFGFSEIGIVKADFFGGHGSVDLVLLEKIL